jgi:uncharacterized protein (DUF1501 family)
MKQDRREFLTKSCGALSMTALATHIGHFGLMSAFAQKSARENLDEAVPSDYRALVCIYFGGGNDGNNTVIPNHNDANVSNYQAYFNARNSQDLAIPQASLLPIAVPRIGNLTYGLHPSFGMGAGGGIHALWAQGKMAMVTNCGTLVQPLTRQQYQTNSAPRPFNLFSHSDQSAQQQTARADALSLTGWGGRVSDKMTAANNPGSLIPTITAIAGGIFTTGENTLPVSIAPAPASLGSVLALAGNFNSPVSNARLDALQESLNQDTNFELVGALSSVNRRAIEISRSLSNGPDVTVTFPNTEIGNQLKQVARLIKNRSALNINRQIFFCNMGGFDTHTVQLTGQGSLFGLFSAAARAFYDEMVAQGMQNQVTQFTLSDFSRTFNPTGSGGNVGTDHAWANHMFVIGGSVIGGDFYGMNTSNGTPFPTLVQNGPDDADSGTGARGRWIPTTSVEQYAATLARWFGLAESDTNVVFPNLPNFTSNNLGFMTP